MFKKPFSSYNSEKLEFWELWICVCCIVYSSLVIYKSRDYSIYKLQVVLLNPHLLKRGCGLNVGDLNLVALYLNHSLSRQIWTVQIPNMFGIWIPAIFFVDLLKFVNWGLTVFWRVSYFSASPSPFCVLQRFGSDVDRFCANFWKEISRPSYSGSSSPHGWLSKPKGSGSCWLVSWSVLIKKLFSARTTTYFLFVQWGY